MIKWERLHPIAAGDAFATPISDGRTKGNGFSVLAWWPAVAGCRRQQMRGTRSRSGWSSVDVEEEGGGRKIRQEQSIDYFPQQVKRKINIVLLVVVFFFFLLLFFSSIFSNFSRFENFDFSLSLFLFFVFLFSPFFWLFVFYLSLPLVVCFLLLLLCWW